MTVAELIAELQTKPQDAKVKFQNWLSNGEGNLRNVVTRIDNFGHEVVIVTERGIA